MPNLPCWNSVNILDTFWENSKMMIEAVRDALSKLNDEEREIINRLYFNDETIRSVAETKKYPIQLS